MYTATDVSIEIVHHIRMYAVCMCHAVNTLVTADMISSKHVQYFSNISVVLPLML